MKLRTALYIENGINWFHFILFHADLETANDWKGNYAFNWPIMLSRQDVIKLAADNRTSDDDIVDLLNCHNG